MQFHVYIIDMNGIAHGFTSTHKSHSDTKSFFLFFFKFFLPASQHVLDMTPVLPLDKFRDLVLGQPLEILEIL